MNHPADQDRRRSTRRRVLKAGRILIDGKSVISCTVRNFGAGGVRLDVPSVVGIPDTFVLEISGEDKHRAHVIWRQGQALGVELLAA